MTKEELAILQMLSNIGKRIDRLEPLYADANEELKTEVHRHLNALQRIIFAREGLRYFKKLAAGKIIQYFETPTGTPGWLKNIIKQHGVIKAAAQTETKPVKRKWTKKDTQELKHLMKHGKPAAKPRKK